MSESAHDRWLSIGMSVLLHGTIIGLLGYSWWRYEHRPITPSVSLEATVVDAHSLKGGGLAPKPTPKPPTPPPVSAPQGPPAPTPQEQALRQQAAEAEQQRLAAAQAEQQRLKQQQAAEAKTQAEAKAQAKAKAEAEAKAEAKARARAKRRAEAKQRAEARKRAAAKKLAEERKLAAERAAKARAERIAQLQQALREDAQSNAQMRSAVAGWITEVTQRVEAAWIKPPTARSNLSCTIRVVLVPGGAVSSVSLGACNGDEAVRESIEAAVYRASPLPPPPDPDLYHQQINFVFAPNSN
ncbi:MAG: cell envelope integrity protein TolA [Pseudomonadota bacterium]|jgi:colicin import membrane protein|nr:cell envelope integrity protein TolA [Pseudomonadota bacterium]